MASSAIKLEAPHLAGINYQTSYKKKGLLFKSHYYWGEGGTFTLSAPNAVLTWVDGNKPQEVVVVISDASYDEATQVATYTVSCQTEGCLGGAGALSEASLFIDDTSIGDQLPTDGLFPSGRGSNTYIGYKQANENCIIAALDKYLPLGGKGGGSQSCIAQRENVNNDDPGATITPFCVGQTNFSVVRQTVATGSDGLGDGQIQNGAPVPWSTQSELTAQYDLCSGAVGNEKYGPTAASCETDYKGNLAFLPNAKGYSAAIQACNVLLVNQVKDMNKVCRWPELAYAGETRYQELLTYANNSCNGKYATNSSDPENPCSGNCNFLVPSDTTSACLIYAAPNHAYRSMCAPLPPPPPKEPYWQCILDGVGEAIADVSLLAIAPEFVLPDAVVTAATFASGGLAVASVGVSAVPINLDCK